LELPSLPVDLMRTRLLPPESGATLRALLTKRPQEILEVRAEVDQAEIPDQEAEAYANVGASTSLPDLAVGATISQNCSSNFMHSLP